VGAQVSVSHGLLHNSFDGGDNIRSSHGERSSDNGGLLDGFDLNLNLGGCSRGNRGSDIGIISISSIIVVRISVSAKTIVSSVSTISVSTVVAVVDTGVAIVSVVVSFSFSIGISFGNGFSHSFTFGQTSLFQGTDSAAVSGDAVIGSEGAMGHSSRGSGHDWSGVVNQRTGVGSSCGGETVEWSVSRDSGKSCVNGGSFHASDGSGQWAAVSSGGKTKTIGQGVIDIRRRSDDLGIGLTLVETVHVSVAIRESIAIGRTAIKAIVVAITVAIRPVGMRVPVVSPIKVCWVGFRLSQSKRGKGENYDQQLHGDDVTLCN